MERRKKNIKLLDICNSHEFILLCHIILENEEEEKNVKKNRWI